MGGCGENDFFGRYLNLGSYGWRNIGAPPPNHLQISRHQSFETPKMASRIVVSSNHFTRRSCAGEAQLTDGGDPGFHWFSSNDLNEKVVQ